MTITTNRQWKSLERRSSAAFALAGLLIIASLVVPVGLGAFTDRAWAPGLVLVGLAVLSVSVGLIGFTRR